MSKKLTNKKEQSLGIDLHEMESVLSFMKKHGLSHFEWEKSGVKVSLSTSAPISQSAQAVIMPPSSTPVTPSAAVPVSKPSATNQKQILSPFVGTFYRAASPGSDPYVREGQNIKVGDVLCIVEAMKLMNEIESEVTGKIVSVLIENGQPVEFGEPLFIIE